MLNQGKVVHRVKKEHEDIAWSPASTIRWSVIVIVLIKIKPDWINPIVTVLQATGQVEESIGQKILRKVGEDSFFFSQHLMKYFIDCWLLNLFLFYENLYRLIW